MSSTGEGTCELDSKTIKILHWKNRKKWKNFQESQNLLTISLIKYFNSRQSLSQRRLINETKKYFR